MRLVYCFFVLFFYTKIKLLLFTLHVDWTMAEYNMFTMGIGLNSDIGSKLVGGTIEKSIDGE